MPTIEERVAYLEGKDEKHSHAFESLKDMMIHLDSRINALDAKVDRRIDALEGRINAFNGRISTLEGRINALDEKVDRRIDALDAKLSKYFLWLFGIQVSILLAIIATLLR